MTAVSYLMVVSTSQNDIEVTLAVLNIAGRGQAFYGQSDSNGSTNLWLIPNGKKSKQEVITQLKAIPAIRNVGIVALSKPFMQGELQNVRDLFVTAGLDTGNVSDEELFQFIDAKLQGKYTYYIDANFKTRKRGTSKIRIRPSEELTHFSPDWLKESNSPALENEDGEVTIEDIEIRTVTIVTGNRRRKKKP
jgi:hypothetical protein